MPSRSARRRPGAGAFLGWAELRSRERKPLICRALCRLIPSVTSQPPTVDRGCRIALFDRENHASKARTCAGEGSNHLIRDVKSICQRLFILITSPRRGEVGRRPGEGGPPQRATKTRRCRSRPTVRSKLTLHQPRGAHPGAPSPYLLQWCVFKISYMHLRRQGHEFDRNILSRMDLKFSENSINNTVARGTALTSAPLPGSFVPNGSSDELGRGTTGIVRAIVNGCSQALIRGAADPTIGGQEPIQSFDS